MYENIKDHADLSEKMTLADVQAQIFQKYQSTQGKTRIGTLSYTQRQCGNTVYSNHVKFTLSDDDENSGNSSDEEEDREVMDDEL